MKAFLMLGLCLSVVVPAMAATAKFSKLECSGTDGQAMFISGLGSNRLEIKGSYYMGNLTVKRATDGDCKGRKSFCAEIGGWMLNIPQRLANGEQRSGYVWENGDADDRPENNRLGDRYRCIAVR